MIPFYLLTDICSALCFYIVLPVYTSWRCFCDAYDVKCLIKIHVDSSISHSSCLVTIHKQEASLWSRYYYICSKTDPCTNSSPPKMRHCEQFYCCNFVIFHHLNVPLH